ncbi:acyl-CoA thioester hydrolase [Paenibacillus phyllosphaerae]|uniref:Acyl-CoA thioester hydrolase n=1 Tax=Paenibacillus phyllosphaerae TaxID=274593 RepID=A0A7W5AT88_9BACL|nr:thioesterase family protein [Paenibacillus phyllosphaerae]MBB3108263.1 acyl-CoA thioester hydrolase [Paenibacillus phyllosphaerae]
MEQDRSNTLWHLHPLRVRYQETDQMGVVYHGNYVNWFEIGRTEFVRHYGMSYREIEEKGLLLPVVDLACKFILPAKYDDCLLICTAVEEFSPIRLAFASEIRRVEAGATYPSLCEGTPPGELLVRGGTKHVWVNSDFRPSRLDKTLPELYAELGKVSR